MKKIILLLIGICIAAVSFSQVNVNAKSIRLINADSTQGTLNGTVYYGVNGFRFRQGGVWYKLSHGSVATVTASSPLVSTGGTTPNISLSAAGALISGYVTAGAQTFGGGKTFFQNGVVAGLNTGTLGGDPSSPVNGDLWYNSTSHAYKGRLNGATITFGTGTIGGSIAATQVGYGSGSNTLTGEATFTYDPTADALTIGGLLLDDNTVFSTPSSNLHLSAIGARIKIDQPADFTANASFAGLNIGTVTADPSTANDGDFWYRSDLDVYRGRANGATITFGTGSGDMILASTQTSTGKKTFQADATNAGINVSSLAGNPSSPVNGDLHYNSSTATLRTVTSGVGLHVVTSGGLTPGRVSITTSTADISSDAGLTYNSGTDVLTSTNITVSTQLINSALTATRIPVIGASGLFTDNASFTFGVSGATKTLTVGDDGTSSVGQIYVRGDNGGTDMNILFGANISGENLINSAGNLRITTNGTGSDIIFDPTASGPGYIIMVNLPTSCAGAPTGSLANIAGVLNICP